MVKNEQKSNDTLYNVEFLRILLCLIIVYYHILNASIIPYVKDSDVYLRLQGDSEWACWAVECFLIMGGYFLFYSEKRNKDKRIIEIFMDKLIRLWPVLAFNVFINILFFHMRTEDAIFQLSFLHCTGISLNYRGFIWFIAPFFWSTMIIIGIVRSFKKNSSIVVLGFIMWLGYSININYSSGMLGRETVFSFLNLGFVRVLAGLILGYLTACFIEKFKIYFGKCTLNYRVKSFICSIIEITAFVTLFKKFVFGKGEWSNAFIIVIIFTILFCSFVNRSGLLSRVLNKKR